MNFLKRLSALAGKYMSAIIILATVVSLVFPEAVGFIKTSYVNTLLGIVMFGMGLTLKPGDFRVLFTHPRDVAIGFAAQFIIMPSLAYLLTVCFRLPVELAIGVILVGTCPGGTASNVMSYLAKADVALSVGITSLSTLFAPILTPLLTSLLAGATVDVHVVPMFMSIVQVVILPILLGFIANRYMPKFTERAVDVLPLVSTLAIVAILMAVVSVNAQKLLGCGLTVLVVVILHNGLGYALGYAAGKITGMAERKCRAVAIEVGMQNSGLATSLATVHFAQYPLATIPGAVFCVWHNVSGALLANIFARKTERDEKKNLIDTDK